jgi:hypothetical protein
LGISFFGEDFKGCRVDHTRPAVEEGDDRTPAGFVFQLEKEPRMDSLKRFLDLVEVIDHEPGEAGGEGDFAAMRVEAGSVADEPTSTSRSRRAEGDGIGRSLRLRLDRLTLFLGNEAGIGEPGREEVEEDRLIRRDGIPHERREVSRSVNREERTVRLD